MGLVIDSAEKFAFTLRQGSGRTGEGLIILRIFRSTELVEAFLQVFQQNRYTYQSSSAISNIGVKRCDHPVPRDRKVECPLFFPILTNSPIVSVSEEVIPLWIPHLQWD